MKVQLLLCLSLLLISSPNAIGIDNVKTDQSTYIAKKTTDYSISQIPDQMTYTVDVVIMGFEGYSMDTNLISSQLPQWYSPMDRFGVYSYNDKLYGNYSIEYRYKLLPTTDVTNYKTYIDGISSSDTAPWSVQGITDTANYVPSELVENYLYTNYGMQGPTIVLIDTYSSNTAGYSPYFYNSSSFDIDFNERPRSYGGKYQISGGGQNNRLLWYDFSAGPTDYRGGVSEIDNPPIWDYNTLVNSTDLMYDMSYYIQTAVELRFTPSFIYEPVRATQAVTFEMLLVDLSQGTSSVNFTAQIDTDKIVADYSKVNPNLVWDYTFSEWDWSTDANFVSVINAAYNSTSNDYEAWSILDYLDQVYTNFFTASTIQHEIIPVFLFAFPGTSYFDSFLGVANSDWYGEFTYVVAALNEQSADPEPNLTYLDWYPTTSNTLGSGFYTYVYGYTGDNENFMEVDLKVTSGTVNFYVLDEYNYNQYAAYLAFTPIHSYSGISTQLLQNLTIDVMGNYYFVVENLGVVSAGYSLQINEFSRAAYGYTFVVMHEVGHALGLPHPHDGYSYLLGGEYLEWLWDLSYSQMTYAQHYNSISKLDLDTMQRGMGYYYLEEMIAQAGSLLFDLQQLHTYVPESMVIPLDNLTSSLNGFVSLYYDYSRIDNMEQVIINRETILSMIDKLRVDMYDTWNELKVNIDIDISIWNVDLVIDLNNGSYNFDNLMNNTVILNIQQWTDYTIHVFVNGIEEKIVSGKTWDGSISIDMSYLYTTTSIISNTTTTMATDTNTTSIDGSNPNEPSTPSLSLPISIVPVLLVFILIPVIVRQRKRFVK